MKVTTKTCIYARIIYQLVVVALSKLSILIQIRDKLNPRMKNQERIQEMELERIHDTQ